MLPFFVFIVGVGINVSGVAAAAKPESEACCTYAPQLLTDPNFFVDALIINPFDVRALTTIFLRSPQLEKSSMKAKVL